MAVEFLTDLTGTNGFAFDGDGELVAEQTLGATPAGTEPVRVQAISTAATTMSGGQPT